jgi:lysophospholipase L1-like esterase
LTRFAGAGYYSDAGVTLRQAVNSWIRTSGAYDAVADFDAMIRDPANPGQIGAASNINARLHPNDAGYKAMAEGIELSIFASK